MKHKCSSFLVIFIAALLAVQGLLPCLSADEVGHKISQIDDLTRQILLKEIELQRFNIHYLLEVAKQGRWKGWRYALFQEANGALSLSGGIISTVNRGANLYHSEGVKLHPQEAANYIPMIGNIIGASAAALEFSINNYHELIARKKGFSPANSLKTVEGLKNEIDALMLRRDGLIKDLANEPASDLKVQIATAEGKILRDTLHQTLQEFARYHIGARKLLSFQQMQYLFDVGKNTTNAIGAYFAYLSLARAHRIWNGRAGVLFVVSGQLTMFGPILSRLYAKAVGDRAKKKMNKIMVEAADANIAELQADIATLDRLVKQAPSETALVRVTERQAIFDSHEKAFESELLSAQRKDATAKLTATQNIGAGLYVGASKVASGVLFVEPGFNQKFNSKTTQARKVTNELLFASAVVGLPATTFSMLDTLRIQVKGEINRQKSKKAGTLPGQIAAARLKELDEIEQRLKAP